MTDPRSEDLQRRLEAAFKRNKLTMPKPLTEEEKRADWQRMVEGLQQLSRGLFWARLGPRKGGINHLYRWAEFGGHLPRPAPPTFGTRP